MIPNNVRTVRLTAAAGTNLARASSRDRSSPRGPFSPSTGVYNPKAFVLHAASLGQACAHCRRFSTAASRRSLGSVSVPVCRATLARPVGIEGLVGRYPANYLIPRRPVPRRTDPFGEASMPTPSHRWGLPAVSRGYTHPRGWLPSPYSPFRHWRIATPVRLACLIHAANVHSEPGSNPSQWFPARSPEGSRPKSPSSKRSEEKLWRGPLSPLPRPERQWRKSEPARLRSRVRPDVLLRIQDLDPRRPSGRPARRPPSGVRSRGLLRNLLLLSLSSPASHDAGLFRDRPDCQRAATPPQIPLRRKRLASSLRLPLPSGPPRRLSASRPAFVSRLSVVSLDRSNSTRESPGVNNPPPADEVVCDVSCSSE